MIQIDMTDKVVLITGGTRGIGLATALAFGRAGARTYLTYKWGSQDFAPLYGSFEEVNGPRPVLIQADASVEEDTKNLLDRIKEKEDVVDYFINNVGVAPRTMDLQEYKKRSLFKTLEYSAWPLIDYTKKIKEVFGKYPGSVVGISSSGPDRFYPGYDFVAASKALLELFAKYLSFYLLREGGRINIIRFGPVRTESFSLIFGDEFFEYLKKKKFSEEMLISPEECGKAVFAVCSGLLDAMNGQIITVDRGMSFQDNLMMRYFDWKSKKSGSKRGKNSAVT
jgi:NAD(P)-dependent dehydrogenase (short-subunit alcohol dehydrogenase family)